MIEEGGGGGFSPMAASSAGGSVQQRLRYQVIVSRGGGGDGAGASAAASVVGCMPLDRPSAATYQWLPLSAAVRGHQSPLPPLPAFGGGGGTSHTAEAGLPREKLKEGSERKPAAAAGYKPVRFSAPRESGMVVLHAEVEVGSGKDSGGDFATGSGGQQQGRRCGGGRVEVRVRPWCDRDSVEAWISQVRPCVRVCVGGEGGGGVEIRVQPWCDRDSVEAWISHAEKHNTPCDMGTFLIGRVYSVIRMGVLWPRYTYPQTDPLGCASTQRADLPAGAAQSG